MDGNNKKYRAVDWIHQLYLVAMLDAVTFSIGAATFERPPDGIDQAIEFADLLMYDEKNQARTISCCVRFSKAPFSSGAGRYDAGIVLIQDRNEAVQGFHARGMNIILLLAIASSFLHSI